MDDLDPKGGAIKVCCIFLFVLFFLSLYQVSNSNILIFANADVFFISRSLCCFSEAIRQPGYQGHNQGDCV